jgi:hypothetical protein
MSGGGGGRVGVGGGGEGAGGDVWGVLGLLMGWAVVMCIGNVGFFI